MIAFLPRLSVSDAAYGVPLYSVRLCGGCDKSSRVRRSANRRDIGSRELGVGIGLPMLWWSKAHSTLGHHVPDVVELSPDEQMVNIAACAIVTAVAEVHSVRDWTPMGEPPGHPVNLVHESVYPDYSVSMAIPSELPFDTTTARLFASVKKELKRPVNWLWHGVMHTTPDKALSCHERTN